jgi:hypothetical protein
MKSALVTLAYAATFLGGLCFSPASKSSPQGVYFNEGVQVAEAAHLFRTQSKKMACDLEPAVAGGKGTGAAAPMHLICERFEPSYMIISLSADKAAEVLSEGRDAGGDRIEDPILPNGTWWANQDFGCLSEASGLTCKNQAGYGFLLTTSTFRKLTFSKH